MRWATTVLGIMMALAVSGCEAEDDEALSCGELEADPCGDRAQCVDTDSGHACQPTCDSNDDCADDGHCDLTAKTCVSGAPMVDAGGGGEADAGPPMCRREIRTVGEGLCCDLRAADGSAANGICLDGQCKNAFSAQDNPRCAE